MLVEKLNISRHFRKKSQKCPKGPKRNPKSLVRPSYTHIGNNPNGPHCPCFWYLLRFWLQLRFFFQNTKKYCPDALDVVGCKFSWRPWAFWHKFGKTRKYNRPKSWRPKVTILLIPENTHFPKAKNMPLIKRRPRIVPHENFWHEIIFFLPCWR